MKINAFTLMEVTVAMLISAICITICYSAYGIITNYYTTFHLKNQEADTALSLVETMKKDIQKGRIVTKEENGFNVALDSSVTSYAFENDKILRKVGELHTDTFAIKNKGLLVTFEGKETTIADTLDQVRFELTLGRSQSFPVIVHKLYSAENLFH